MLALANLQIKARQPNFALSPAYSQTWCSPLWGGIIHEPFTGAWQQNAAPINTSASLLSFSAVYCCVTGIASDIAKLRIKLDQNDNGIWTEIMRGSPFLGVLRKPNDYQTTIDFLTAWMLSKLLHGNTYVLLRRDNRGGPNQGVLAAMYVLDPCRVTPLVADNGDVYYDLKTDYLSGLEDQVIVPASEIIHDRMPPLWHPLIGVSPLVACATSAGMGSKIQANSQVFFGNRSIPGGMLTAPGRISDETANRMKEDFEKKFSGPNIGRLLVGGDGLEFKPFVLTAEQSQLVDQLKWSVSDVSRAFHYPEFKLTGVPPPYAGSMQALNMMYYSDCLQAHIESIESHLDEAMALAPDMGVELDTDNLLRMDAQALADVNKAEVSSGVTSPNEARFRRNLGPVAGGESPYLQQQNYSLAALAKRDAAADPFSQGTATAPQVPARSVQYDDEAAEFFRSVNVARMLPQDQRIACPT